MRADYWTGISERCLRWLAVRACTDQEAQELGFHTVEDLAQWQEPMRTWLTEVRVA